MVTKSYLLYTLHIFFVCLQSPLSAEMNIELTSPHGVNDETEVTQGATLLTLSSLFYGTEHFDRSAIIDTLTACGESASPFSHISIGPNKSTIHFRIDNEMYPLIAPLLAEMQATNVLQREHVEMARQDLLERLPALELLHTFTPTLLSRFAGELILTTQEEKTVFAESNPLPCPLKEGTLVIDGKIFINNVFTDPASFKENFRFYSGMGTLLSAAAWFYTGAPLFAIPMGMFLGPYLTEFFLSDADDMRFHGMYDPTFIRQKRAEDLKEGFHFAYVRGTIAFTLTPYERRNLFIEACTEVPATVPIQHFPIICLADFYDLKSPILQVMLYPEEELTLTEMKKDFIAKMSKFLQLHSEQQINKMRALALFQDIRDIRLDTARIIFESNVDVKEMHSLLEQWKKALADGKGDIEKVKASYEEQLNNETLVTNYEAAKKALEISQADTAAWYRAKEENWEGNVDQEVQKQMLNMALVDLYQEYNNKLCSYVSTFCKNDPNFRDFLDHRPFANIDQWIENIAY